MKWLCIEVCDRELLAVHQCATEEEAIHKANECLFEWAKLIGFQLPKPSESDDYALATSEDHNAWCNYKGTWDAYAVELKEEVSV